MNQYYALIGDIIESRSLANRAKIQEALSQALNGLNERYQGHLASCFSLTLGDEFQGLLKVGAPIFQMIDEFHLSPGQNADLSQARPGEVHQSFER